MKVNLRNNIGIILVGIFFLYLGFAFSLELFKINNDCGEEYKDIRSYNLIKGRIVEVGNNDTIYRLGFKLDKYKNKCLVCKTGDSLVYVKMRILSNRYDIKVGDSLYSFKDTDIFTVSLYRDGEERPKIGLY